MSPESKIIAIVTKEPRRPEIPTLASDLHDMGDVLTCIEILMAVESEFDLEISDEQAESIKTVGDLVGFVERALGEKVDG